MAILSAKVRAESLQILTAEQQAKLKESDGAQADEQRRGPRDSKSAWGLGLGAWEIEASGPQDLRSSRPSYGLGPVRVIGKLVEPLRFAWPGVRGCEVTSRADGAGNRVAGVAIR